MSDKTTHETKETGSLANSMMFLLAMTVFQRGLGLVRGTMFCRVLPAEELGLWDVAQGFLIFAAPFVSLSVAGAFTRFVSVAESQGRLSRFLWQAAVLVAGLTGGCILIMRAAPQYCSWLIYGSSEYTDAAMHLSVALFSVVAFNFCGEALSGLRCFRQASLVQFCNALLFAAFAITFLWQSPRALGIIDAYSAACLVSVALALCFLYKRVGARNTSHANLPDGAFARNTLWPRVLRFAAWMWLINGLTNLFDLVDRYVLLHLGAAHGGDILADVGQYHTSRLAPLLLVNLAALVSQTITSHVSHAWESGRRAQARRELRFSLKLAAFGLTTLASCALVLSPWMFDVALAGKFSLGQSMFPATLVYSIWSGLTLITATYLWCIEKAGLASLCTFIGLIVNLTGAICLAPLWGLAGVVMATCLANAIVLGLVCLLVNGFGCRMNASLWVAVLVLPLAPLLGGWTSLVLLAVAPMIRIQGRSLFTNKEASALAAWVQSRIVALPVFPGWLRVRAAAANA